MATHAPVQPFVGDILAAEDPSKTYVSFEFFPPRTEKADELLTAALNEFLPQRPTFIDVTWGAGGTTSEKTVAICAAAKAMGFTVNMHLTCTNMPRGKVQEALDAAVHHGIRNIVALRGDPPAGKAWEASEDGFSCALDLVKYIQANYPRTFSIAVAGYPEGHPNVIDAATGVTPPDAMHREIAYLKEKVDAGATAIITQLFYDPSLFVAFVKRCREAGITVPILPGLLPVVTYAGLQRIVSLCKTYLPPEMKARVEALKDDEEGIRQYGIQQCTEMCQVLKQNGVHHFHFYTLNQSASTIAVMKNLGLAV